MNFLVHQRPYQLMRNTLGYEKLPFSGGGGGGGWNDGLSTKSLWGFAIMVSSFFKEFAKFSKFY